MLPISRLRVVPLAVGCIVMGWLLTSSLGPAEQEIVGDSPSFDMASAGVLEGPSGFGWSPQPSHAQPGILGDAVPEDDVVAQEKVDYNNRQPSVSGALADLHHAVKGKLKSWNPYHRPDDSRTSANMTSKIEQQALNATSTALELAGEDVREGVSDDERLGARTRIGKVTILFNGNSFWERAIRTHEEHDKNHGYRLHVLRERILDDVWSKPAYMLSLVLRELAKPESERLDWLFWVDADTVILNPHIPIELFLPPPGPEFEDIHLIYSSDWNGLNNGIFPVRVNSWAVQLFSAITSYRHYRPDGNLQFRDQSAMDAVLHEPGFVNNIVEAPQRWFNAYQGEHNETLAPNQIRRGDFLVHFAGVPDREERMDYWLNRAEQHLDDWEIPVKSTSYPQEVNDFWAEQRALRREHKESLAAARLKAKEVMTNTDGRLSDYGDRLTEEQRSDIEAQKEELTRILEDDKTSSDIFAMEEASRKLDEIAAPLTTIITEVHKSLLASAHETIFGGEKDLLDGGFDEKGVSDPELEKISESVRHLKELVMTPQEQWNKHDISAATEEATKARAKYQDKMAKSLTTIRASSALRNEPTSTSEAVAEPSEAALAANVETFTAPEITFTQDPVYVYASAVPAEDETADAEQSETED